MTPFRQITLNLSEAVNSVDAQATANYELRGGGTNHVVGDSDDVVINITPTYTTGSSTVVLIASGLLSANNYRLTVYGSNGHALHDLAGIIIDGDNNGSADGDYVRNFTIVPFQGDYNLDNTVNSQDYQVWRSNYGATSGPALAADGNANGTVDAADYVLWRKRTVAGGAGAGSNTALAAASNSSTEGNVQLASGATTVSKEQSVALPAAADTVETEVAAVVPAMPNNFPHQVSAFILRADAASSFSHDFSHQFRLDSLQIAATEHILDGWAKHRSLAALVSVRRVSERDSLLLESSFDSFTSDSQTDAARESEAVDSALDELFVELV
jgi:hypothetical protein